MMINFSCDIKLIGDDIPWLRAKREAGQKAFLQSGVPAAKSENWKYTKPNRFFEHDFTYSAKGNKSLSEISVQIPFEGYCIFFENGVFNPQNSLLPQGVEVVPLIEAIMFNPKIREKIGTLTDISQHPFAALNEAYLNEGVYLHIDSKVNLKKPVTIIYHVSSPKGDEFFNLHNLIVVDEESSAEIVEYYCCDGDIKSSYFTNVVNEIYIDRASILKHTKLQDDAFKSAHIALNTVKVKQNGRYQSFCMQKGADMARNETEVCLSEEGADTEVNAAYIMNGWATIDTTTDIRHLVPHTTSSQLVKGVVGGQAKGVFQGKIHIAPNAVKTEGYQLHKAMLLSDDAEIDTKPELEIFADDVKCSHGSACGELDKDQLFYMQSRGIPQEEAKHMLIKAYLNDVIAKVDNEKIRDWIKLSIKDSFFK